MFGVFFLVLNLVGTIILFLPSPVLLRVSMLPLLDGLTTLGSPFCNVELS